jgi:hypothetical protein
MSQAEGFVLAVWAFGVIASFVFWFRISREIPASERNDPFAICMLWPVVLLLLALCISWFVLSDLVHVISKRVRA